MTHNDTPQSYKQMFNLPKEHRLTITSHRQIEQNSTVFKTSWFDEHDEEENLIAQFRAWTNQSLKPPYRKQRGWERFSLSGELLDREVRYSKRPTNDYLH